MSKQNPKRNKKLFANEPLRVSLIYFLISCLWILLSDRIVFLLFNEREVIKILQTYKGIFFVFISSIMIFFLVHGSINRINKLNSDLRKSKINHKNTLNYYGTVDIATGLPNKIQFEKLYNNIRSNSDSGKLTFLFIDIDNFKHINDILGISSGDILLKEMGFRLKTAIGDENIVSRISGDEFGVIIRGINSTHEVEKIVHLIQNKINQPVDFQGERFFMSCTIGIAVYPDNGDDFDTLLNNSYIAMQYGKIHAKTGHSYYNESMDKTVVDEVAILSEIRKGLINKEFQLHYQIIKNIKLDKIYAAEALLRWYHPVRGYIPPLDFITIAEKTNLIFEIRKFVIDEALRQKKIWKDKDVNIPIVGINLSLKSFCSDDIVDNISNKMKEYGIGKQELALELTESGSIADMPNLISNIEALKKLGVRISLDDFGTGYSSLARLKELPIDSLKIDKAFIDHIHDKKDDEAMVSGFINVANTLGVSVIAEGIEYEAQLKKLVELGCYLGQGYYLAKPMPADKLEEFLSGLEN